MLFSLFPAPDPTESPEFEGDPAFSSSLSGSGYNAFMPPFFRMSWGEGGGSGRRARRKPPRKGLWYDWSDPAGRRRNARNIAGGVLALLAGAVALWFRVLAPASATLDLEFDVKGPPGVTADVSHTHEVEWGGRRKPATWKIELVVKVRNQTSRALSFRDVEVGFRGADGERIPLRDTPLNSLVADDAGALSSLVLLPGKTRTYRTPVPLRIKASGGRNVVRGEIRFEGVSDFTPEFLERIGEGKK
jgi:hypothetical protein